MANFENFEVKSARKKTVTYEEGFAWTIEGFEEWWSSIELDQQVRSKVFQMEVDDVQHKFQLSVFKYLQYDSIVDSHTVMLSLSLFYHGPENSIIVKPHFQIQTTEQGINGRTLKSKRLRKNTHSDAWVWSSHWLTVFRDEWNTIGNGSLTFCTLIQIQVGNEPPRNTITNEFLP